MMYTKRGDRVPEEAAALKAARHPGVVELVDVNEDVLRTRMVDAHPVWELAPLSAAEIAGLAAAVAVTLADLHDLGVVHGGIDSSHVLLTATGRPVLCSLGRGGDPADDVAALGHLVMTLLSQAPPEQRGRRLSRSRLGRRRLGPMLAPVAGPTLLALAAEAVAPDPATRPTARALADAISRHIPAARLPTARSAATAVAIGGIPIMAPRSNRPGIDGPGIQLPPRQHSTDSSSCEDDPPEARAEATVARRRTALTAVGGGVLGLVAVAAVLASLAVAGGLALSRNHGFGPSGPSQARSVTITRQAAPAITGMRAATTVTAVESTGPEPFRPAESTAPAEVTPDSNAPVATQVWPLEPLELKEGVLTFRGSRFAVGRPGDVVVAGDWSCTGEPSLALLRRDTGQVFVFDEWPKENGMVTARPLARVEGATDLKVGDGEGNGCHALDVERRGAFPVRLQVRAAS